MEPVLETVRADQLVENHVIDDVGWIEDAPLCAESRKRAVDVIYAAPLSDAVHHSVTEHSLVVEKYLLKLMANDPTLKELNIEHSFCTDVAIVALSDAIMCNSVVTVVDLSGNPLTDMSALLLAHALTVNRSIRCIRMRNVHFSRVGILKLAQALVFNDTLTEVDVDEEVLGCSGALVQMKHLLRLHQYDTRVVTAVKDVYRASQLQPTAPEAKLKLSFSEDGQMSSLGTTTPLPFDQWAFNFAFLCLEASSNNEPEVPTGSASVQPSVVVVDVDLSGQKCIYDSAIDIMVRCVRKSHEAHSRTQVRLGVLQLSGTRVTSSGIEQLIALLEEEPKLVHPESNRTPLIGEVIFGATGFEAEAVERLMMGLSLRLEPSVVKSAALRLLKEDPTLLHVSLATTAARPESAGADKNAVPQVSDASMRVLQPLLLRSTCIVSLEVPFGELTDTSAPLLGDFLVANRTLQLLDLRGNHRLCLRGAAKHIARGLGENGGLMSLNLSFTGVDVEGGCDLADALLRNRTLTVLDLSHNPSISGSAAAAFEECVGVVNKVVREVRLVDCGIPAEDMQRIENQIREAHEPYALRAVLATLHSIRAGSKATDALTEIRLGVPIGSQSILMRDTSLELLGAALAGHRQVRLIDISGNAVTSDGMKVLFKELVADGADSHIQTLIVSRNPIGNIVDFSEAVVEFLRCHRHLKHLEMNSINLRSVGLQPIIDALLETNFPTTLSSVACDDNMCHRWQLSILQILLKSHNLGAPLRSFLKSLWSAVHHASFKLSTPEPVSCVNARGVCRNRMSSTLFVELCCELLQLCKSGCRKLILAGNLLEDDSVAVLAASIGGGMQVAAVDIRDNNITDKGVDALMVNVLRSETIRDIRVTGNKAISVEAERALAEALSISKQPQFLKRALLHLCNPQVAQQHNTDEEGAIASHLLDVSSQLSDHLTDDRFGMLLDALCANGSSRMSSCCVANNHVGRRSLCKLLEFATSSDSCQRRVVEGLVSVSFRNTMVHGADIGRVAAQLFHALPHLTSLDLSANDLCGDNSAAKAAFSKQSLPPLLEALDTFDHILSLNLDACGLPVEVTEPVLQRLELNNSGLKPTMRLLASRDTRLVSLSLEHAGLTERNITLLLDALSNHPVVRDLDLSGNDLGGHVASFIIHWCDRATPDAKSPHHPLKALKSSARDAAPLHTSGDPHPSSPCRLRTLLLDRNCLSDVHAEPLLQMLLRNETLQCVSILDNDIAPQVLWDRFVSSRELFEHNNVLTDFHVDAAEMDVFEYERFTHRFVLNHPQLRSVKSLLPCLSSNASDLTGIDLSETDGYLCDTVCYEISEALAHNTHVHVLTLPNGSITDEGLLALCRALIVNRSVTSLDLRNNSITDTGVSGLFDVLSVNAIIRVIELEGNRGIGAFGVSRLSRMLLSNHTVSVINIDTESVAKESVEVAEMGLMLNRTHPTMKTFLLSEPEMCWTTVDVSSSKSNFPGTTFGDAACACLCKHLGDNTTVEVLDMSDNDLTFEACYSVAALLQTNRSITSLNLSRNAFGTGVFHLIKCLHANHVVTRLDLNDCMASEMYLETIDLLVALNKETSMLKDEALSILDDPSHHRVFTVIGDIVQAPEPTRPTRRKRALDDDAMPVVDRVIRFSSAIQDVRLPHNHITNSALGWFIEHTAPHHHNITALDLSHNLLDDDCVSILRTAAEVALKQLKHIDVSNNALTDACIPALTELMEKCGQVEVCHISGHDHNISVASRDRIAFLELLNRVASEEARRQFIRASHHDPTLTTIDLKEYRADGRWRLNRHYMSLLGYVLPSNPCVRSLQLDDSAVDDELLGELCHKVLVLRDRTCALAELTLNDNLLEDVSVLVDCILSSGRDAHDEEAREEENKAAGIKVLRLDGNKMILKSARSLACLLRQSSALEELKVADNAWGRTGAVLIQSALCNSTSVVRIALDGPGVPNSIVEAARCSVESNALHNNQMDLS